MCACVLHTHTQCEIPPTVLTLSFLPALFDERDEYEATKKKKMIDREEKEDVFTYA